MTRSIRNNVELENVAIAYALQLEVARAFPALITTPWQVWCRRTYPLPYYSVFAVDTLLYAVTLTSDSVILPFDLWPWTFAAYRLWRDETKPNLKAIEHSAAELLRFQCLTLWPWTCFTCCARLCDNFHQIWPSTTYPCLNYCVFLMLIRYVMLWPWPLTRWSWKFAVHQASCGQSLHKIWAKSSNPGWIIDNFANFCTCYVTPWPWPLTFWHWNFTIFWVSCV